jgi:hypothetical protein
VGISIVFEMFSQFPISGRWGCPTPKAPGEEVSGNVKFTIYALLVPKMHHMKFENNWSSGYQEVKNLQMLTDTIHHVWPRPGDKTSTPRIMKLTILVKAFLLYITMHLVFLTYMLFQRRRFFFTIGQI